MITWYHPEPKLGVVDWTHDAFTRIHCSYGSTGARLFRFDSLKREIRYDENALISGGPIDACEFIPAGRMYAVKTDRFGAYPVADTVRRA